MTTYCTLVLESNIKNEKFTCSLPMTKAEAIDKIKIILKDSSLALMIEGERGDVTIIPNNLLSNSIIKLY